jgi:hypothetical protein
LQTPLSLGHAAGVTVNEIAVAVSGTTTLTEMAPRGTKELQLSTRAGLVPGSVLRMTTLSGVKTEYGIVDTLGPGMPGAGSVRLRQSTFSTFLSGIAVEFISPGAVATTATLMKASVAGSGVVLASQTLIGTTLEIDPGGLLVEYRNVGALTDVDGYYSFDGVRQVKQVFLEASHGGFTSKTDRKTLDFDQMVNILDFRLP